MHMTIKARSDSPSRIGGPGRTKTGTRDAMNAMRLIAAAAARPDRAPAVDRHRGSRRKLLPSRRAAIGRAMNASSAAVPWTMPANEGGSSQ